MDQRGLCVWNGEWGPVYARKQYDGEATDLINERRYHVLKDQLDIYNKVRSSSLCFHISLTPQCFVKGPPQLVYLDLQRRWLPGHGVRQLGHTVHDPLP